MTTLQSANLRTVDVARAAGCSVQQVRVLEGAGVLPPADRTRSGYRVFRSLHVRSARAYRHLVVGVGPVEAKRIVRAAHESASVMLTYLDAAHAGVHRDREALALARAAAGNISAETIDDARPEDAMTVTELAAALGVRASTLRHWDAEGLVVPERGSPRTGRRYAPDRVRDARIVHELRRAGYRIPTLRIVMRALPLGGAADVIDALAARDSSIEVRSRALLDAAVELSAIVNEVSRPATPT